MAEDIAKYNGTEKLPELRSEGVNEVLNQPPAWLVRWGTTVFFGILLVVLSISWFIKYPDLVSGSMQINATNFPKSVQSRSGGRVVLLYAKNGEWVKTNQTLGVIESTADYQEVLLLEEIVNQLIAFTQKQDFDQISSMSVPLFFQLGELQKPFQVFQEKLISSKTYLGNGTLTRKRSVLLKDLATLKKVQGNLNVQMELLENDLKLAREELESKNRLAEKGFVSKADARQSSSQYLAKKQAFEQAKNSVDNSVLAQYQKEQELVELDNTITEQKNDLIQSIHILKSEIENWKHSFVLKAPTSGRVVFIDKLQENQVVRSGQELFYIQPRDENYYGELQVGQFNMGKVRVGQEVLVKFQAYPFQEYGIVVGKVDFISDLPRDSTYVVHVKFDKQAKTNANKTIPLKNGMTAQAEIVTEDLRLLERFFREITKNLKYN